MKIPWANDTWKSWDKLDHFAYAHWYWLMLAVGVAAGLYGLVMQGALFALGVVGLEVVQYVRLRAHEREVEQARSFGEDPPPRPVQADLPSWRDLIADLAGGVSCGFLLHLLRLSPVLLVMLVMGCDDRRYTAPAPPCRLGYTLVDLSHDPEAMKDASCWCERRSVSKRGVEFVEREPCIGHSKPKPPDDDEDPDDKGEP